MSSIRPTSPRRWRCAASTRCSRSCPSGSGRSSRRRTCSVRPSIAMASRSSRSRPCARPRRRRRGGPREAPGRRRSRRGRHRHADGLHRAQGRAEPIRAARAPGAHAGAAHRRPGRRPGDPAAAAAQAAREASAPAVRTGVGVAPDIAPAVSGRGRDRRQVHARVRASRRSARGEAARCRETRDMRGFPDTQHRLAGLAHGLDVPHVHPRRAHPQGLQALADPRRCRFHAPASTGSCVTATPARHDAAAPSGAARRRPRR